jgi:hypothetical protein
VPETAIPDSDEALAKPVQASGSEFLDCRILKLGLPGSCREQSLLDVSVSARPRPRRLQLTPS